jgi:TolA-binding protein
MPSGESGIIYNKKKKKKRINKISGKIEELEDRIQIIEIDMKKRKMIMKRTI